MEKNNFKAAVALAMLPAREAEQKPNLSRISEMRPGFSFFCRLLLQRGRFYAILILNERSF